MENGNPKVLIAIRIFNVIAYAFNILINILSSLGKLGYGTNGQISAKYETNLTPSGYAFSIWGLIFLLQGIFAIYQAIPFDRKFSPYLHRVSFFLGLVWVFEGVWDITFSYEIIWLSLLFMYLIFACLAIAFIRLQRYPQLVFVNQPQRSWREWMKQFWYFLIVVFPTSLNFGWITAAATINTLITIQNYGGFVVSPTACVGVSVGLVVLVSLMLVIFQDIPYAFPVIWAFLAISERQKEPSIHSLYLSGLIGASTMTLLALIVFGIKSATKNRNPITAQQDESPYNVLYDAAKN